MLSVSDIITEQRAKHVKPSDDELRRLPYKNAFIYGRLSSQGQVQDSHESVREIADLVSLAIKDGYHTALNPTDIKEGLERIQQGTQESGVWQDGQVTVDVRDLGLSGSLTADDRPGLVSLQQAIRDGLTGAVYLTEGVSRLSRDRERIIPYALLKMLKDNSCRVRTPDGIWSPSIQRDWDYLAEEFENAIEELAMMGKRLSRRRRKKASRGEFVGGPVPPGFILPIVERESDGRPRYGKLKPYPPHARIVEKILREFVKQGGSKAKTHRALGRISFPCFTPEFNYMERHTSLRRATRTEGGYLLSPAMIRLLALNPKLIGVWTWGDIEAIPDNHEAIVPASLFMEAYQLAKSSGKPRGKGVNREPLVWNHLLYCCNHDLPNRMSGHTTKEAYRCQRDYIQGRGLTCFDIAAHYLDEPLTAMVLQQLDFTAFSEEVLLQLETDDSHSGFEVEQRKKEITTLERRLENLKPYLGCGNKEREEFYWEQIEKTKYRLTDLRSQPMQRQVVPTADYHLVRDFLAGLPQEWGIYSRTVRNRLLRSLIDRVDIRHGGQVVEATICWKTGQTQAIEIQRARTRGNRESHWGTEEFDILKKLWPNSSRETISVRLPGRTWKAIAHQAHNLRLRRALESSNHITRRRWEPNEEDKAKQFYEAGTPITDIALNVGRSYTAVLQRAWEKDWQRSHIDQRMDVTKLSSINQNPKVSKNITSGPLLGGQAITIR